MIKRIADTLFPKSHQDRVTHHVNSLQKEGFEVTHIVAIRRVKFGGLFGQNITDIYYQ